MMAEKTNVNINHWNNNYTMEKTKWIITFISVYFDKKQQMHNYNSIKNKQRISQTKRHTDIEIASVTYYLLLTVKKKRGIMCYDETTSFTWALNVGCWAYDRKIKRTFEHKLIMNVLEYPCLCSYHYGVHGWKSDICF